MFFAITFGYLIVSIVSPNCEAIDTRGSVENSRKGDKDNNGFNNSSANEAITKMVNPGDRINIPCSVGLTPGGSVQWVQNGKPILLDFSATQRRHWNITNDGWTALTINRVTKIDEGVWECWELDSQGNVKQRAHVMRLVVTNVPEEPYIEFDGHRLTEHTPVTVRENTEISLSCIVRGASPPVRHIFWYLSHENITHTSKLLMEYSAEEDISLAISIIKLNVTQDYHKKTIICQVYHVSWLNPATVSASFNILYVPAFSITREPGFGYPVIEGMSVSLQCEIDANPKSTAVWHRDPDISQSNASLPQMETQRDGSLNFSHISKSDSGWYRCTTQHEFGYFASFGYYLNVRTHSELQEMDPLLRSPFPLPPRLGSDSVNKDTEMGSEAALMKSYEASKESFDSSIGSSDSMNSDVNHKYNAHNVQNRQKECNGNHINNGEPVIESINRTVIALVGSQISLTARFCCSPRPKKVYWIHRHLAIMPQRIIGPYNTRELIMTSDSMNCFTSTFEISSVKPEDAGDILFMVLNSKGIDNAMVSVNVTVASFSISKGISTSFGLNRKIDRLYHWIFITLMSITSLIWRTLMADPIGHRHRHRGHELLMKSISVMS